MKTQIRLSSWPTQSPFQRQDECIASNRMLNLKLFVERVLKISLEYPGINNSKLPMIQQIDPIFEIPESMCVTKVYIWILPNYQCSHKKNDSNFMKIPSVWEKKSSSL